MGGASVKNGTPIDGLKGQARHRKSVSLSSTIISGIVGIADGAIIVAVGAAFYLGYVGWDPATVPLYLISLTTNVILTVGLFYFAGLYDFDAILAPDRRFGKIIWICALVFMIMIVWAFALKVSSEFSRVWFFFSQISETILICLFRLGICIQIRSRARAGEIARRIAVVGGTEQAARFIDALRSKDTPWNEVIGVFDDRLNEERTEERIADVPVMGNIGNLLSYIRHNRVDDVVVALPWNAVDRLLTIIGQLRELPVNVRLAIDMISYEFPNRGISKFAGIPLLDVAPKPLADWKIVMKAIEDKVFATLVLIAFGPLMALIAIAIKFDSPGPVIFRQKRFGFNNKQFDIYKFRTMRHGRSPEKGVPQAKRNDPRMTRVGKFLRRASLDELPQIFNVLKGTMSLVGPRPHAVDHNEEYAKIIAGYFARHRVKPGITGWAQVNGLRGETDTPQKMEARVEHDIYYMENWSLFLDLRILAKTAIVVFENENAY